MISQAQASDRIILLRIEFLHEFLDFENATRLIVFGIILIVMMILRPDGLLTRDSLRRLRLRFPRWRTRHA